MGLNELANLVRKLNAKEITQQQFNDRVDIMKEKDAKEFAYRQARIKAEAGGPLENMSPMPKSLDWFIDNRIVDNKVSAAEKLISTILDKYHIQYVQEASMHGLILPSGGYARYDFLLYIGSPFVLIEYNGKIAHSTEYHMRRDELKKQWCIDRGIRLVTWDSSHYYHMEEEVGNLMSEYNIRKKKKAL